jgi:hypothetical protein
MLINSDRRNMVNFNSKAPRILRGSNTSRGINNSSSHLLAFLASPTMPCTRMEELACRLGICRPKFLNDMRIAHLQTFSNLHGMGLLAKATHKWLDTQAILGSTLNTTNLQV